jgi:hypothetical protein
MVTKEQAMRCRYFHFGTCERHKGPRGGVTEHIECWRGNGQCKTWKTRPNDFQLPIKHGLYTYNCIDQSNSHLFHVAEECPLLLDKAHRNEQ